MIGITTGTVTDQHTSCLFNRRATPRRSAMTTTIALLLLFNAPLLISAYRANITIKTFFDKPMIFANCTMSTGNITHMPVTLLPSNDNNGSITFVESSGKGLLGRTQGICYFTIPNSTKQHDPYNIGPWVHWCIGLGNECGFFGFDTPVDKTTGLVYGGAGCDYSYSPLQEMETSMCVCGPGVSNADCLKRCNCDDTSSSIHPQFRQHGN